MQILPLCLRKYCWKYNSALAYKYIASRSKDKLYLYEILLHFMKLRNCTTN